MRRMTSIRKYKKWWKSYVKREWYNARFSKRLETLRKLTRRRVYILNMLDDDGLGMGIILILYTKSRRKRGGHEG